MLNKMEKKTVNNYRCEFLRKYLQHNTKTKNVLKKIMTNNICEIIKKKNNYFFFFNIFKVSLNA